MQKVLFVGPYGIGNLLMALPVIDRLHRLGQYHIDIACLLDSTALICNKIPEISRYFNKVHEIPSNKKGVHLFLKLLEIRKQKYNQSILLFPSAKRHYNLMNKLVGANVKIGSKYPRSAIKNLSFLNTIEVLVKPELHDCQQNFEIVNQGLHLSLKAPSHYIFRNPVKTENLIGIHPGCKVDDEYKRWGTSNFVKMIFEIDRQKPNQVFRIYFGPDEKKELLQFHEYLRSNSYKHLKKNVVLCHDLSLLKLFDSISECSYFISNDSGLMHIAASQGVKTAGLFGPSDPKRTGPFSPEAVALYHDIECRPCSHTNYAKKQTFICEKEQQFCLTELAPQKVVSWYFQQSTQ